MATPATAEVFAPALMQVASLVGIWGITFLLGFVPAGIALTLRSGSPLPAIVAVAGAAGPLLGGVLIHQFGWRSIFLINLPLGMAGLWLARRRILAAPRRPRALNPLSHLLGVIALSSLCFVLIQGNAYGWTSSRIAGVTALVVAVLIWRRNR